MPQPPPPHRLRRRTVRVTASLAGLALAFLGTVLLFEEEADPLADVGPPSYSSLRARGFEAFAPPPGGVAGVASEAGPAQAEAAARLSEVAPIPSAAGEGPAGIVIDARRLLREAFAHRRGGAVRETDPNGGAAAAGEARRRAVEAKAAAAGEDEPEDPARLRGRVVDPEGLGIADARVSVRPRRGRQAHEARTDSGGSFELSLPAGRYVAYAGAPGFAPSGNVNVRLRAGQAKELAPIVLAPGGTLRGSVQTLDGLPIPEASIRVRAQRGEGRNREARSDALGEFALEDLREELYRVNVEAPGYVSEERHDVPVTAEQGGELAFRLRPSGRLEGTVRITTGEPLARGMVFAYRGGRRLDMTRADDQGRFAIGDLDPGPLELFARADDFSYTLRTETEIVAGRLATVDLVLEEGPRVTGTLRRTSGEPVEGYLVRARDGDGEVRREGRSDAEGNYLVQNMYPGTYELTVWGTQDARTPLLTLSVEVSAGELRRDLVVPSGATVEGTVLGPVGEPIAKAPVFAISEADYSGIVQTDDQGRYRAEGLPAGDYQLYVRVDGDRLVGWRALTLDEGAQVERFDLQAYAPAQLRGRVVDPQGEPVEGVELLVTSPDAPIRRTAVSDEQGVFALGPLYDGRYRLEAPDGPLGLVARRLEVTSLDLAPWEFVVEEGQDLEQDLSLLIQE